MKRTVKVTIHTSNDGERCAKNCPLKSAVRNDRCILFGGLVMVRSDGAMGRPDGCKRLEVAQ